MVFNWLINNKSYLILFLKLQHEAITISPKANNDLGSGTEDVVWKWDSSAFKAKFPISLWVAVEGWIESQKNLSSGLSQGDKSAIPTVKGSPRKQDSESNSVKPKSSGLAKIGSNRALVSKETSFIFGSKFNFAKAASKKLLCWFVLFVSTSPVIGGLGDKARGVWPKSGNFGTRKLRAPTLKRISTVWVRF